MSRIATTVLRYWLALLRHEEALAVRPRARRVPHEESLTPAQMLNPASGQDYAKLPFDGMEAFFVKGSEHLERPVANEVAAFFEDWLAGQYRRGAEEGQLEHLIFFPTVLLPRQELAGLVRLPVHIEWRTQAGQRFVVPKPAERARKQIPLPPCTLRIVAAERDVDGPPFFVDGRLLRDALRIDAERLDSFFATLKADKPDARRAIAALCDLLREQLRADGEQLLTSESPSDDATLLRELCESTRRRLAQCESRSRAFDVAVLADASRNRTTFHVQRDLQVALALLQDEQLTPRHPLSIYLGQRKSSGVRRPLLGRFGAAGLTASQRSAGELFLGSSLAAVQGPPGTGKTHLISSLGADELIRKLSPLATAKQPGVDFLLVTSTNNRAVDNVVQPMGRDLPADALPLSLRVGSRDVVDKVTVGELQRALRWLERRSEPSDAEWAEAKRRFFTSKEPIDAALAPSYAAQETADELARVSDELSALEQELASQPAASAGPPEQPRVERASELLPLLSSLITRLRALSELADANKQSTRLLLDQHFKLTQQRHVEAVESRLGRSLSLHLPPRVPPGVSLELVREAWEDAAEEALGQVLELREALELAASAEARGARRQELQQELVRLERRQQMRSAVAAVDWEALQPQLVELFAAACALRECWARKHKQPLTAALKRAVEVCGKTRSLRALLGSAKGPGVWLQRLYPVWGCTLLSLGNNFLPELESVSRVVIDEAGQCHSAYAASAMLRARSILVIGDTHQLEPVVDVSVSDEARVTAGLGLRIPAEVLERYRMYEGCENSAQSLADAVVVERPTLVDHFRCQPEIANVCERLCRYGLSTRTRPASCRALLPELDFPLLHVPVEGVQERFSGSWVNHAELLEVRAWVERLLRAGLSPGELGVITPFRGQLEMLWRSLREARIPLERAATMDWQEQESLFSGHSEGVALGTVHRFQGGERRIIVFSTAVTQPTALRFVDARVNLVNVAASRAREHLLTIGHTQTLLAGNHTHVLLEEARRLPPLGEHGARGWDGAPK